MAHNAQISSDVSEFHADGTTAQGILGGFPCGDSWRDNFGESVIIAAVTVTVCAVAS